MHYIKRIPEQFKAAQVTADAGESASNMRSIGLDASETTSGIKVKTPRQLFIIPKGDWIVVDPNRSPATIMMSDKDFKNTFRPLSSVRTKRGEKD